MESWVRRFLPECELPRIEKAVTEAESKTSGEIVPMIVERSSAIGHVIWFVALIGMVIFLTATLFFDWHHSMPWWFFTAASVFIAVSSIFLSRCRWVQRWGISGGDRSFQVLERAEIEFHRHHLNATKNRTAILIMLSLMEHEAVILADKAVAEKLAKETWDKIIKDLIADVRNYRVADGLIKAITSSGEILSQNFPPGPDDRNELKNHLIIKR